MVGAILAFHAIGQPIDVDISENLDQVGREIVMRPLGLSASSFRATARS